MKRIPIALVLTDTHLAEDNSELVKYIWEQAVLKCQELKINKMFFDGDFFTTRKAQPLFIDDIAREIVQSVLDKDIELFLMPGNHDKVDLTSERSYLDEYKPYKNCTVISAYDYCVIGLTTIHFVPYFKEQENYSLYLERAVNAVKLQNTPKHILLTHIAVNGVRNNDGTIIDKGVGLEQFKCFDTVMVGHYHNQSKIGDNIYYIGSAYQSNFGEDDKKGFTILYSDGTHEFIQSTFPKYIKHTVDISDEKKIKKLQKEYAHSDDNIRIIFKGDETQLASLNKEKFNAIGIDIKFEKEVIRQDLSAVLDSNINFDRSNINQAFEQFCELNDYQDKELGLKYINKLQS